MRLKPNLLSRSFALVGNTRGGKSTVLRAAASVAGHKPEAELPTFNFSEAGSAELFESYNGLLLPLDDLEAQGGNAKAKHENAHRFAFLYADGQSKKNSKYAIEAGSTSHATWRGLCLVPAEFGPDALAKRAGEIRQPGAAQRFIQIPVGEHVFDLDHREHVDVSSLCAGISKIVEQNYGCPLNTFLRKFSNDLKKSRAELLKYMSELSDDLAKESQTEQFRSVADYFSMIGAAGMLASDFRIVEVKHSHIKAVMKRLFLRAVKYLDAERYEVRRGLKKLRTLAKKAPRISKGKQVSADCQAYVLKENGKSTLVIARKEYNKTFDDRVQGRLVAKHESLSGKISARAPNPLPASLDWAAEQIKWPIKGGVKRRWSICIEIEN